MLSLPSTGIGSGVGVALLSGRKMVLKPLPVNAREFGQRPQAGGRRDGGLDLLG
jgi:hypothetical protein